MDREQQLIDAAMRYHTLLAGPQPVSVREFAAMVAPDLRAELIEYLEFTLAVPEPQEPIMLTAAERALAERAAERARVRAQQRLATAAPAQTITALRQARKLSLRDVATQINLPIDLLHRIERGGVRAGTIPNKLINRFAVLFEQGEGTIHAALAGPPVAAATRLSAQDATGTKAEEAVDFADALAASTATDAQKAEWA